MKYILPPFSQPLTFSTLMKTGDDTGKRTKKVGKYNVSTVI